MDSTTPAGHSAAPEAKAMAEEVKAWQVVAGEAHTMVLTELGQVLTWGKGFFGRLGTGRQRDEAAPAHVHFPSHSKLVAIAAGAYHSLALADDGTVWSWGYNLYGQLGHDEQKNAFIPNSVFLFDESVVSTNESSEEENKAAGKLMKAVSVEAGGMMSCAIDESGCLWMWGSCPVLPDKENNVKFSLSSIQRPEPVRLFSDMPVCKVACGNEHVVTLVQGASQEEGKCPLLCYSWGGNNYGQLGLGDRISRSCPEHVKALDHELVGTVSLIACGAFHTVVIAYRDQQPVKVYESKESEEENQEIHLEVSESCDSEGIKRISSCWSFGMGSNGQLGHGTSEDMTSPKLVVGLPEQASITGVACGLFHTGILTEKGDVWVWGMEKGLGLIPGIGPPGIGLGDALSPLRALENESSFDVDSGHKKLACGAAHTVVIGNSGSKLWSWGRGQNGVLGTGNINDSVVPCQVIWPPPVEQKPDEIEIVRDDTTSAAGMQQRKDSDALEISLREREIEKKLSATKAEIHSLRAELSATKNYANSLHSAIYGSQQSAEGEELHAFQEWERTINAATYSDLVKFEAFYRKMRSRVKEVMLQRKIGDYCSQFMKPYKERDGKN